MSETKEKTVQASLEVLRLAQKKYAQALEKYDGVLDRLAEVSKDALPAVREVVLAVLSEYRIVSTANNTYINEILDIIGRPMGITPNNPPEAK